MVLLTVQKTETPNLASKDLTQSFQQGSTPPTKPPPHRKNTAKEKEKQFLSILFASPVVISSIDFHFALRLYLIRNKYVKMHKDAI